MRTADGVIAEPADIRALAFLVSLGPAAVPCSDPCVDEVTIDLAGEEALIVYLGRVGSAFADAGD